MNAEMTQTNSLTATQTHATDFFLSNWSDILENIDASALTRRKYKTDALAFVAFVEKQGLALNTFRAYKDLLERQQNLNVKTKNLKLIAAKRILSEMYHRYRLTKIDLSSGVKLFKVVNEHTKDGLSQDEIESVKKAIDQTKDNQKRLRLTALYYLLTFQGLRQNEVSLLQIEDLRLSDLVVYVKGKGKDGKERIDLHPDTAKALSAYIQGAGLRSGFLFSNAATGQPITTRQLRKLFTDKTFGLFPKAGISSDRSLHGFRHYFVTRFLEVTSGDVLTVQQFSRHKSLLALKMYDDRKKKKEMLPVFYNAFN